VGGQLASSAAATLGGEIVETECGPCVRVVRTYGSHHRHGILRIGDCLDDLESGEAALHLLTGGPEPLPPAGRADALPFVDIETTGLSGGAGTYAFLVGCARLRDGALLVEQFLMAGHAVERALLSLLGPAIGASGALVTYNGKSFDVPVLETRFLFHRQRAPFAGRPHIDMLHTARRLWRGARGVVAAPGVQDEGCALTAMEQALFAFRRHGDVPGFEIPARFFAFLRSADARPLAPVFEHNRLDLVSLAALTARAVRLLREAPDGVDDARECYGVGKLLEARGEGERAEAWYERAVALGERSWHAADARVRVQALRALALRCRRQGRYGEAAAHWEAIVAIRACPSAMMREALEALAVHHEHRSRDLERARRYAEHSRTLSPAQAHGAAVEHRLARLRRKLGKSGPMLLAGEL
jgi:uncharacterized protein YprB with RNaseH-like and TPR domain